MSGATTATSASGYQQCVRCVLDTNDRADIDFDSNGLCNHCRGFDRQLAELPATDIDRQRALTAVVERIRKKGEGRPYDCILGISGGVDSSALALLASRHGLRPLVVHFDNGWNSELAVKNIENIVGRLGYDLKTYVIDWQEFRELQLAYLRASVVDIELLTDHAIEGALMRLALENRIPFVLSGNNVATEGVLPFSWTYRKGDYVNIKDIHRRFGNGTIRTYPFLDRALRKRVSEEGIEVVTPLDYVAYNKAEVKKELAAELGWRDYGGKHYESVFTRFYQTYILPVKFGIDKRKAHLSALICSGQITKADALAALAEPPDSPDRIAADREYVLKKLGLCDAEFDAIMGLPIRSHLDFEVASGFFHRFPYLKPFKPVWKRVKPMMTPSRGLPPFKDP